MAAMLMIVPLMIWSTRRLIDSHAWRSDTPTADRIAATRPMRSAGVTPSGPGSDRADDRDDRDRHDPAGERGRQHRALDADVHDARPLAGDAAQGPEAERGGGREDRRGRGRQDLDR